MCRSRVHRLSAQKMCGQSRVKHPRVLRKAIPSPVSCAQKRVKKRAQNGEDALSRQKRSIARETKKKRETRRVYTYTRGSRGDTYINVTWAWPRSWRICTNEMREALSWLHSYSLPWYISGSCNRVRLRYHPPWACHRRIEKDEDSGGCRREREKLIPRYVKYR